VVSRCGTKVKGEEIALDGVSLQAPPRV